jgi:hypothetical protein
VATFEELIRYRKNIKQILSPYANVKYANGDFHNQSVFDENADRYLAISTGFEGRKRYHGCVIDIAIRDGKVWLEADNTDAVIARELVNAGIPKNEIVLGFRLPELRGETGYATA